MKMFNRKAKKRNKTADDIFRDMDFLVADFLCTADEFIDKQKKAEEVDR